MPSFSWASLQDQLAGNVRQGSIHVTCLQLQEYVENTRLDDTELNELVDISPSMLLSGNQKVCQDALRVLHTVLINQATKFKPYIPSVVPATVQCLGDSSSPVRTDAVALLAAFMQNLGVMQLLKSLDGMWGDKNWRIRQGMAQTVAAAAGQFRIVKMSARERDMIVTNVCGLLDDSNSNVREAAVECIVTLIQVMGNPVKQAVQRLGMRANYLQEIDNRLAAAKDADDDKASMASFGSIGSIPEDFALSPTVANSHAGKRDEPARRGGYKDPGVISDTELRNVEPIPVDSERMLKTELDKIGTSLALAIDWDKRVAAMVRLEALLKGGAASFDCFYDQVYALKDALANQVQDRRSCVARQACHLLTCLAASLGGKFEHMAQVVVPHILKVTPVTVQVMAESADAAMHGILSYCHAPRLVTKIAETLANDKSPRLRYCCAKYLLQILEDWDPHSYDKNCDSIELAVKSAFTDALGDVRQLSRLLVGALAYALPDRTNQMIRRLDSATADKYNQAIHQYPGAGSVPFHREELSVPFAVSSAVRRPSSNIGSPTSAAARMSLRAAAGSSSRPSSAGGVSSGPASRRPTTQGDADQRSLRIPQTSRSRPGSAGPSPRPGSAGSSVELNRPATARAQLTGFSDEASRVPATSRRDPYAQRLGAQRLPLRDPHEDYVMTGLRRPGRPPTSTFRRVARDDAASVALGYDDAASVFSDDAASVVSDTSFRRVSVLQALGLVRSAGKDWQKKAEGLMVLSRAVSQEGLTATAELTAQADKLTLTLVDAMGETHQKVVCAAMEALAAVLRYCPQCLQSQLERLVTQVFQKAIEPKDALRKAAYGALTSLANHVPGDSVLQSLNRSLDAMKTAKGKQVVLDFAATNAGPVCGTAQSYQLKQWMSRVLPLLNDKAPELRKATLECLQAMYKTANGANALQSYISGLNALEQVPIRKSLMPILPELEKDLVHHTRVPVRRESRSGSRATSQESLGSPSANRPAISSPQAPRTNDRQAQLRLQIPPAEHHEAAPSSAATYENTAPRSAHTFPTSYQVASPATSAHSPAPALPPAVTALSPSLIAPASPRGALATPRRSPLATLGNYAPGPSTLRRSTAPVEERVQNYINQLRVAPQVDTIQCITDTVAEGGLNTWKPVFAQVSDLLLNTMGASDAALREAAVLALHEFCVHCPSLVAGQLGPIADGLINGYADASREVVMVVDEAAEQVVASMPKSDMLEMLMKWLPGGSAAMIAPPQAMHGAVKNLSRTLRKLRADDLQARVPSLLPALREAWNHSLADVRKSVVFCLVEMWKVLGDDFLNELSTLPPAHHKLLTVYIERTRHSHAAASAAADLTGNKVQTVVS